MVESFSLCRLLYELIAGAVSESVCTYGCIREIFESRYLRGVGDGRGVAADSEPDGGGAAATASVHIKNTELKFKMKEITFKKKR